MATSDELNRRRDIKISYLITGEGGLSIFHDCTNYATVLEADNSAIERAINLAKVFTGISLYRVFGRAKEEIIWRKPKMEKKLE
jgi:hypothetical protein